MNFADPRSRSSVLTNLPQRHRAPTKLRAFVSPWLEKVTAGVLLLALPFALSSCVSVKAYQKMYLNDTEMELAAKKVEVFETNYEAYREGAAGANGGKVGGGCGCN
jgi:hypothetical protein